MMNKYESIFIISSEIGEEEDKGSCREVQEPAGNFRTVGGALMSGGKENSLIQSTIRTKAIMFLQISAQNRNFRASLREFTRLPTVLSNI